MRRLLVRRVLISVPLFFLVTVLSFVTVAFIPGNPAVRILGADHTLAQYQALDRQLGLDEPVLVQYWHWLDQLFHGSLGSSLYTSQSVFTELNQRIWCTLSLVIGATLVSVVVGVAMGVGSTLLPALPARLLDGASWLGFALPNFWLGLVLVELLALKAHLLPPAGYVPLSQSPGQWLNSLILPVLTLAAAGATGVAKQTRTSLSEVLGREFVTSLVMAGLPYRTVVFRHALRNAALPVVTIAGLFFVAMLSGTIVVEQVFVLPGVGSLAIQAATDRDLPVIEGVVVYFTLIVIAVNLLVDLSYAWLNPRVRAGYA
jgi:peptide/nickel transport system permease protein